jgi:hypothetical protein
MDDIGQEPPEGESLPQVDMPEVLPTLTLAEISVVDQGQLFVDPYDIVLLLADAVDIEHRKLGKDFGAPG